MNPLALPSLRHYLPEHDLMCVGEVPVCYHCHHFNLFLDQTIDDTLGAERGAALRFDAAREFSFQLLVDLAARLDATTVVDRIELAQGVFAAMGHGRLELRGDGEGGEAIGNYLHYSRSWHDKYGRLVKRSHPADAVACGFGAAALELAFGLDRGTMDGEETRCVAMRARDCHFRYRRATSAALPGPTVNQESCLKTVKPLFQGQADDEVAAIATGLKDYASAIVGDERGLFQAFGVYLTMHLTNYYSRLSYDAVSHIEEHAPRALGVLETLLRESGHVCVFNAFGGVLLSPEWEGLVGELKNDPIQVVIGCLAIGRALGFGHWSLHEIEPGRRVVLRTPSSYEASYHLSRRGVARRQNEYFLQGAALAITQLAHRVDWEARPVLSQRYYSDLFRGGVPWRAEQTRSLACGDSFSELVVSRVS